MKKPKRKPKQAKAAGQAPAQADTKPLLTLEWQAHLAGGVIHVFHHPEDVRVWLESQYIAFAKNWDPSSETRLGITIRPVQRYNHSVTTWAIASKR
jgi:hypothetical protein